MNRETFLSYHNFFYLWISLLTIVILSVLYIYHSPLGGANGGTVLGYSYGVLATIGVLYLMWYGIRKRSYAKAAGSLKGALAAHVWIGVSLLLIVPLHSGFQFGLNVHTFAYVLMVVVILSGIWGAFNYITLAPRIQAHRGGGSQEEIVEQILFLSAEIERIVASGEGDYLLRVMHELDMPFSVSLKSSLARNRKAKELDANRAAILLSAIPENESDRGSQLIELISKKRALIRQLDSDVATLYWMRVWLYLHVPLSFGLLAAVGIHIFSVFYRW